MAIRQVRPQGAPAPSLELAFRIARALDKRLEDVFHYEREPTAGQQE